MDVVVLTAKRTIVMLFCVVIITFIVMSFALPKVMKSACESVGLYNLATYYSSYTYALSNDIDDLADATTCAIMSGDDTLIIKYCEKLTTSLDFLVACEHIDESLEDSSYSKYLTSYSNYVYSSYVKALYRSGETDYALSLATQNYGEFESGNPLASLALYVVNCGDTLTTQKIATQLDSIDLDNLYLENIKQVIYNFLGV